MRFRFIAFVVGLSVLPTVQVWADEAPPPPAAESAADSAMPAPPPENALADGQPVEKAGFSVVPPLGWEIHRDYGGSSFFFQEPAASASDGQRSIEVKAFAGGVYIDAFTANDFAESMAQKYTKHAESIQNFHVGAKELIQTNGGTPALLFYTDFVLGDINMRQMHVLISSMSTHYLMTFSDRAETLSDNNNPIFAAVYQSMISAAVAEPMGSRYQQPVVLGGGLLLLTGLALLGWRGMKGRNSEWDEDSTDDNANDSDSEDRNEPPAKARKPKLKSSRNNDDDEDGEVEPSNSEDDDWNLSTSNASHATDAEDDSDDDVMPSRRAI